MRSRSPADDILAMALKRVAPQAGVVGPTGPSGPSGPGGLSGSSGASGAAGSGPSFFLQPGAPANQTGPSFWLDTDDDGTSLVGATGATGPTIGLITYALLKPASTPRASTVTSTVDPDLQMSLQPGSYRVDAILLVALGTGGLKYGLSHAGGSANGTAPPIDGTPRVNTSLSTMSTVTSPINSISFAFTGMVVVSTTTTVGLYWSQATSDVATTTLYAGTSMIITRLG